MLPSHPLPGLRALPLTTEAFAPFGTVVQAPSSAGRAVNDGSSERFDLVDDLRLSADCGRPMLALFRAAPRLFPFVVRRLERHALGSQTFVPLGALRFVVVAAAGASPRADAMAAFVTDGRQGVVLAPGTWHHGLLAIEGGDFVVIERAAGSVDCDAVDLDVPREIVLP